MNQSTSAKPRLSTRLLAAAICGALFFAAYGACNEHSASLAGVPTAFCAPDYFVPFVPWTIVPYWSLDVLFVTAFLLQHDMRSLRAHTARVVLGIAIACAGFLLFPLRCDAGALGDAGVWSPWFRALGLFDKPFNQAPSLHIILLLVVWRAHLPVVAPRWRPLAYAWGALIAVSTLTTRQHGLVDVVAGAMVGTLLVHLIRQEPVFRREGPATPRLVIRYGALCAAALAAAFVLASHTLAGAWAMLWLATAAGLVAAAYATESPGVYAKSDGRVHWSAVWVLAPVLLPQRLAHRWLARGNGRATPVAADVTFGPIGGERPRGAALLDLTAEHDAHPFPESGYRCVPMADLAAFCPRKVTEAAEAVERMRTVGPVHIVCALGLSRSATVAAAWLVRAGRAATEDEAARIVRKARPGAMPRFTA